MDLKLGAEAATGQRATATTRFFHRIGRFGRHRDYRLAAFTIFDWRDGCVSRARATSTPFYIERILCFNASLGTIICVFSVLRPI
jgi:hypothetical protein